ncbi:siderophore-interacting protein [Frigidibacter sp. MR17.14]|uniref:siderophore-interacting protein n=1 Tax=Frigidibacter sp. MR17.14 TaxID=3126509 RepID=UPI003012FC4F
MTEMTETAAPDAAPRPLIERHRHELKRRHLRVSGIERLSPAMLRLTCEGPDMADFPSLSPEDHVKLIVPDGQGGTAMRDYTPRRFDTARGVLVLDFAIHEAGPATVWALAAQVGDAVEIGGPRGSQVIAGPIADWVLIGDETALPAIGRRIEEMAAGVPVVSLVAVPGAADEQAFGTQARHAARWIHRADAADPAPVLAALDGLAIGPRTFVWVAAEAGVARAVKEALIARGVARAWIKAAGYWVAGEADASDKDM